MMDDFPHTPASIFHLAWCEYQRSQPIYSEDGALLKGKPLVRAWRDHFWVIYHSWRSLMQLLLIPEVWESVEVALDKENALREEWLAEGGVILTKSGKRRKKRWRVSVPDVDGLRDEIDGLRQVYLDEDLSILEPLLLYYSGTIHTYNGTTRKQSKSRLRSGFEKLKWYKLPRWWKLRRFKLMERNGRLWRPKF